MTNNSQSRPWFTNLLRWLFPVVLLVIACGKSASTQLPLSIMNPNTNYARMMEKTSSHLTTRAEKNVRKSLLATATTAAIDRARRHRIGCAEVPRCFFIPVLQFQYKPLLSLPDANGCREDELNIGNQCWKWVKFERYYDTFETREIVNDISFMKIVSPKWREAHHKHFEAVCPEGYKFYHWEGIVNSYDHCVPPSNLIPPNLHPASLPEERN